VPLELAQHSGADADDLRLRRFTPAWRDALTEASVRTRRCFDHGRPIADAVHGRLRWELRATWLGGVRILDRLGASGFNVFQSRPTLGWIDVGVIATRSVFWRRRSSESGGDSAAPVSAS